MTSTITRSSRLPNEILDHVSTEHYALAEAVEIGHYTDIAEALADLQIALSDLALDFQDDWSMLMGSATPSDAANRHLAYLASFSIIQLIHHSAAHQRPAQPH